MSDVKSDSNDSGGYLSASELAQMGCCERLIRYEAKCGRRSTPEQNAAKARGVSEHARYYKEGINADGRAPKPWCFVASCLFGSDAPETHWLRCFRDQRLRHTAAGRSFIKWYYQSSPAWCEWLSKYPMNRRIARTCLRAIVRVLARIGLVESNRTDWSMK